MYIKGNEITISCAHVKVPRSKSIESSKIVKKHEGDDEVEGKKSFIQIHFHFQKRTEERNGTAAYPSWPLSFQPRDGRHLIFLTLVAALSDLLGDFF
jgi:hypothetical protein